MKSYLLALFGFCLSSTSYAQTCSAKNGEYVKVLGERSHFQVNQWGSFQVLSRIPNWSMCAAIGASCTKAKYLKRCTQTVKTPYSHLVLENVILQGINLKGINLSSSFFASVDLRKANLMNVDLTFAHLSRVNLSEANLRGANLNGADLSYTEPSEKVREHADDEQSILALYQVKLIGADLRSASLNGANLRKANLESANLQNADLEEADLSGTNLQKVNLRNANLEGADLRGSDLRNAMLTGARFKNITHDENTQWPMGFYLPSGS